MAGGYDGSAYLASAELYDPGAGFVPSWRPQISSLNPSLLAGDRLTLTGVRLRGISEASGEPAMIRRRTIPWCNSEGSIMNWSSGSLLTRRSPSPPYHSSRNPPASLPNGHYLVTVFANGIPSDSGITRFWAGSPPERYHHGHRSAPLELTIYEKTKAAHPRSLHAEDDQNSGEAPGAN